MKHQLIFLAYLVVLIQVLVVHADEAPIVESATIATEAPVAEIVTEEQTPEEENPTVETPPEVAPIEEESPSEDVDLPDEKPKKCFEAMAPTMCNSQAVYYYNSAGRVCQMYAPGTCGNTANNFKSMEECTEVCVDN